MQACPVPVVLLLARPQDDTVISTLPKAPPFLATMKQAGHSLISTASVLCACFFAVSLACTARAAQVTVTVTGSVLSGTDGNPNSKPAGAGNVFGGGSNLAGEHFTLTLKVSDSEGVFTSAECSNGAIYSSNLSGSSTMAAPTATLQIGNGSFTYGHYPLYSIAWSTGRTAYEPCYSYNSIKFGWSESYTGGYSGGSGLGGAILYSTTNFSTGDLHGPILLANVSGSTAFPFTITVTQPTTLANLKYASGYLVPESVSVSGTSACSTANVSLSAGVPGAGAQYMAASFVAPVPETIAGYAQACNFEYLEWQSTITSRSVPTGVYALSGTQPQPLQPKPLIASGNVVHFGKLVSPSDGLCVSSWLGCALIAPSAFFDPPQGSYTNLNYNPYPFYLPTSFFAPGAYCPGPSGLCPPLPLAENASGTTISFVDAPAAPYYSGATPSSTPSGAFIAFETTLVGVSQTPGPPSCGPGSTLYCTPLYSWKWNSTFNGSKGGVMVTSINGDALPAAMPANQVTATSSGLVYNPMSQTSNGTVTLKNVSNSVVKGPLQLLFMGTPPSVTLMSATGSLSGTQYLTVPDVTNLAAGQSLTVSVEFANPSNVKIDLTPSIYAGSIN